MSSGKWPSRSGTGEICASQRQRQSCPACPGGLLAGDASRRPLRRHWHVSCDGAAVQARRPLAPRKRSRVGGRSWAHHEAADLALSDAKEDHVAQRVEATPSGAAHHLHRSAGGSRPGGGCTNHITLCLPMARHTDSQHKGRTCRNCSADRNRLSPAKATVRQGMLMPNARVPVAITTCGRCSARCSVRRGCMPQLHAAAEHMRDLQYALVCCWILEY